MTGQNLNLGATAAALGRNVLGAVYPAPIKTARRARQSIKPQLVDGLSLAGAERLVT
jgi:hypothetical protein